MLTTSKPRIDLIAVFFDLVFEIVNIKVFDVESGFGNVFVGTLMPLLLCISYPLLDRTRLCFSVSLDARHSFLGVLEISMEVDADVFRPENGLGGHIIWKRTSEFIHFSFEQDRGVLQEVSLENKADWVIVMLLVFARMPSGGALWNGNSFFMCHSNTGQIIGRRFCNCQWLPGQHLFLKWRQSAAY